MQFTTHSKATGRLVLVRLDQSLEAARKNARNTLYQHSINPDDGITTVAEAEFSSPDLERYGEFWPEGSQVHVDPSYPDQDPTPGSGI